MLHETLGIVKAKNKGVCSMPLTTPTRTLSFRELNLLDLVQTGEAALIAGCDRRTFIAWAKKERAEPVAKLKGNKLVYKREDVERVARAYKAFQKQKG